MHLYKKGFKGGMFMAVDFNADVTNIYSATVASNNLTKVNDKTTKKAETEAAKDADNGVVYEKSSEKTSNATYSINKMSEEERANLVASLKADQESRVKQLTDMVAKMMSDQGKTFGIATDDDSVWKLFADGEVTVTEAAKKQAQEDISEDGYWGVKQTSQRLFDFASALAGDDVDKMKDMQEAMEQGYKEATKAWGRELPDISKQTIDAANKLFEDYYASKEVEA